jgi:hypothetical protein
MPRKAKRKSTPARASGAAKKKPLPFHWIVAAALLIAGGGYYALTYAEPAAEVAPDTANEDVVYNRPFRAIHEMGGGPRIPFLPADQPQPKIAVPNSFYDFGRVGAKAVVKRRFLVRNEGDAPLTISRAFTTCGCTVADFTARVIPPGKASLVTLVFDAGFHDVRGQTVKRGIIIENNDRSKPKAEIWTQASVARN